MNIAFFSLNNFKYKLIEFFVFSQPHLLTIIS